MMCGENLSHHTITDAKKRCSRKKKLLSVAVLWNSEGENTHIKSEKPFWKGRGVA
jgi:hypothetical protein